MHNAIVDTAVFNLDARAVTKAGHANLELTSGNKLKEPDF